MTKVIKRSAIAAEKNPNWKGGRTIDADGYVRVYAPNHPNCDYKGRVLEHRLVMEKKIGRLLEAAEVVHHKNEVKDDNHPDNLELLPNQSAHVKLHGPGEYPESRVLPMLEAAAEAKRGKPRPKHWASCNPSLAWPIEAMRRWYLEHLLSCPQIGQLLKRSSRAVHATLVEAKVPLRPRAGRRIPPPVPASVAREAARLDGR